MFLQPIGHEMQSFIKPDGILFGDTFKVINPDFVNNFGMIGKADGHIFDNALRLTFPNGDNFKYNFDDIERVLPDGTPIRLADPILDKAFFDKINSDEFFDGMKKAIRESKE